MPTNVQTMIETTAENAAARGMRHALDETVGGFLRPGIPEGIGFAVGFTILGIGLSVRARRRHLQRIEQKLDYLAEGEPEEELDGVAAAREGRRDRRTARRSRATIQA
jgi:hypothetical protein